MKLGQLLFGVVTIGGLLTCIVAIAVVAPTLSLPTGAIATPTPPTHDWRDEPAMSEQAWQNLLAEARESAREQVNAAKVIFRQDCAEMLPSVRAAFQATCSQ